MPGSQSHVVIAVFVEIRRLFHVGNVGGHLEFGQPCLCIQHLLNSGAFGIERRVIAGEMVFDQCIDAAAVIAVGDFLKGGQVHADLIVLRLQS